MTTIISRLPSRFPVGTKFVIEAARVATAARRSMCGTSSFRMAPWCGCRDSAPPSLRVRRARAGDWPAAASACPIDKKRGAPKGPLGVVPAL